jgi:hypothetical protein
VFRAGVPSLQGTTRHDFAPHLTDSEGPDSTVPNGSYPARVASDMADAGPEATTPAECNVRSWLHA